jgi:hypothetical protein
MELDTPESHTVNSIKKKKQFIRQKVKGKVVPVHAVKTCRGMDI